MKRTIALAMALALAAPLARADLIVVDDDGGPGVDFTTVEDALAAALDGDTIFIRTGIYTDEPVVIDGLSVDLIGAGIGAVTIETSNFKICNLAAEQAVTLRGLTVRAGGSRALQPNMFIDGCDGPVWIEDCVLIDDNGNFLPNPFFRATLVIRQSAAMSLHRCLIDRTSESNLQQGFDAVHAMDSGIFAYDTTILGGHGAVLGESSFSGGDAVVLDGGSFFASGCSLQGGDGSNGIDLGQPGFCNPARSGGNGLALATGTEVARLVDTSLQAGTDGVPHPCDPTPPIPAQDLVNRLGATVITPATVARHFDLTAPVEVPSMTTVTASAPAGEFLFFIISAGQQPLLLANDTALMPAVPITFVPLFPMPGSGAVSFDAPIVNVPAGLDEFWIYAQAGFANAAGTSHTSGGSALPILDPAP